MNNFSRVLRLALRQRWTVAGAIISALLVALLWGFNIGALYPVIEVVSGGQSLQKWIDDEIADTQRHIADLHTALADLEAARGKASADQRQELIGQINSKQADLASSELYLDGRQRLKPYIDRYLPNDPFKTIMLIVGGLMLATIVKDLFLFVNSMLVDRLTYRTSMELRKQFYRRTLRLDLAGFGESHSSELMSRFTYDVESVSGGVQTLFGRTVREPLKMIACLIGAAYICWQLLLVSLLVMPLAGFLISRLGQSLKRANRRAMEEMTQLYTILQESFGGIKVVKAFTMERYERHRLHVNSKQFYRQAMKIARYDAAPVIPWSGSDGHGDDLPGRILCSAAIWC